MFSDEAVTAFRSAIQDEDLVLLSSIFSIEKLQYLRRRCGGMSNDFDIDEIDLFRSLLKMELGVQISPERQLHALIETHNESNNDKDGIKNIYIILLQLVSFRVFSFVGNAGTRNSP